MRPEIALSLKNVSFSYRPVERFFPKPRREIFKSLSFELFRGETLGVLGRNGTGKSSLLRLMAGILEPSSGAVHVAPGMKAALLSLGLGFRGDLSGRDNALLGAMLQGASKAEASSGLERINDFAELGKAFDDPVKTYSSGMRARLGFATSLMTQVDILLIDEVLSVGDAHFREKASHALQERIKGEQTVVFVSHAAAQIRALCDRAIWLEGGEIRACGAVPEVLKDYNAFIQSIA